MEKVSYLSTCMYSSFVLCFSCANVYSSSTVYLVIDCRYILNIESQQWLAMNPCRYVHVILHVVTSGIRCLVVHIYRHIYTCGEITVIPFKGQIINAAILNTMEKQAKKRKGN